MSSFRSLPRWAICILIPIEVGRSQRPAQEVRGRSAQVLAAFRKQLKLLMWLGLVFGVVGIGLAPLEAIAAKRSVARPAAVIWFAVACISFISLRQLAKVPDTEPVGS